MTLFFLSLFFSLFFLLFSRAQCRGTGGYHFDQGCLKADPEQKSRYEELYCCEFVDCHGRRCGYCWNPKVVAAGLGNYCDGHAGNREAPREVLRRKSHELRVSAQLNNSITESNVLDLLKNRFRGLNGSPGRYEPLTTNNVRILNMENECNVGTQILARQLCSRHIFLCVIVPDDTGAPKLRAGRISAVQCYLFCYVLMMVNGEWVYDTGSYDSIVGRWFAASNAERKAGELEDGSSLRRPSRMALDHWKKCRDEEGKLHPPGWLFFVGCGNGAKCKFNIFCIIKYFFYIFLFLFQDSKISFFFLFSLFSGLCMVTLNGTVVLCSIGDVDPDVTYKGAAGGGASFPPACFCNATYPAGANGEKMLLFALGGPDKLAAIIGEEGAQASHVMDQFAFVELHDHLSIALSPIEILRIFNVAAFGTSAMAREMRVVGSGTVDGDVKGTYGPRNVKKVRNTNLDNGSTIGSLDPLGELERDGRTIYASEWKDNHSREDSLGLRNLVELSVVNQKKNRKR